MQGLSRKRMAYKGGDKMIGTRVGETLRGYQQRAADITKLGA